MSANGRFHDILIRASENAALSSALALINKYPLAAPNSIVFRTNNLERLFVEHGPSAERACHHRAGAQASRGFTVRGIDERARLSITDRGLSGNTRKGPNFAGIF